MTQKRYRIEHSLGLPAASAPEAGSPVHAERIEEILSAIQDLRRITQAVRSDLDAMKDAIVQTKAELAALHRSETSGKGMKRAADELDAVVGSTEHATSQLLSAVEEIESRAGMLRSIGLPAGSHEHVDVILDRVISAYEACNFQDLTGQRISKIVGVMKFIEEHLDRVISAWATLDSFRDLLAEAPTPVAADDERSLLNGPKLDDDPGHVDQSDIDALFD